MKKGLHWLGLSLIPFAYLQALWLAGGNTFLPEQAALTYLCGLFVLIFCIMLSPSCLFFDRRVVFVGLAAAAGAGWIALSPRRTEAWGIWLAGSSALMLCLSFAFARSGWKKVLSGGVTALGLGLIWTGVGQTLEHFAQEEFYSALQVFFIAVWFFLLWVTAQMGLASLSQPEGKRGGATTGLPGISLPGWLPGALLLVFVLLCVFFLHQYQRSFYPNAAPEYSGITSENPFLCGSVSQPGSSIYSGETVYAEIIQRVMGNPSKGTAEEGMLAVMTGEAYWRQTFHDHLLVEIRNGAYTGPANSVKYGQYEVSQRLYYYNLLQQQTPLFSQAEQTEVLNWLVAVNRRALTVEWVDWLYAAAFGEWPQGPYLNQDIGVGLLSLLQATGTNDPALNAQNLAFLQAHPDGWQKGFRNSDDALSYQPIWLNNAIFQTMNNPGLLNQPEVLRRRQLAFEWLLAQSTPDGSLVGYNPHPLALAGAAYQGAQMLGERNLLWLAGRSLDYLSQTNGNLWSQPGITAPLDMVGTEPTFGNCLLYAGSGLPNQVGPLAPDKIIFRSGWEPDDSYLLLNLRFTGWHRYKASNAIISIYNQEPWVVEDTEGETQSWLPVGRSAFRDKRIPRENLNGLVVEKTGLSRLLYWLTGFGGPWAQDVPAYAVVEHFQPDEAVAESVTVLQDWNGWTHRRKIAFVNNGPIVIFDQATGPQNGFGGITWQIISPEEPIEKDQVQSGEQISLGKHNTGKMLLLFDNGIVSASQGSNEDEALHTLVHRPSEAGNVRLTTVILPAEWSGADVHLISGDNPGVNIRLNGHEIILTSK